ncbi:hypothetical protein D3C72_2049610 [compost metagenome]
MAAVPSKPAAMAMELTSLPIGSARMPNTMKPASKAHCSSIARVSDGPARRSTASTIRRVIATPAINAGKARNFSRMDMRDASARAAPISTKLPVTWAVNRPNRAIKPRVSTYPAKNPRLVPNKRLCGG